MQTRPFSARATRSKAVNGSPALVIAPAIDAIEGRKPPDLQDRSNSKYPQVVQPQNSVEACVFGDGGADSALEGASVDIGRNREGVSYMKEQDWRLCGTVQVAALFVVAAMLFSLRQDNCALQIPLRLSTRKHMKSLVVWV